MSLLACVIISKILFILNLTGLFTLIIVMDEKYGCKNSCKSYVPFFNYHNFPLECHKNFNEKLITWNTEQRSIKNKWRNEICNYVNFCRTSPALSVMFCEVGAETRRSTMEGRQTVLRVILQMSLHVAIFKHSVRYYCRNTVVSTRGST